VCPYKNEINRGLGYYGFIWVFKNEKSQKIIRKKTGGGKRET